MSDLKPKCKVNGALGGAMCGSVIVSTNMCGSSEHENCMHSESFAWINKKDITEAEVPEAVRREIQAEILESLIAGDGDDIASGEDEEDGYYITFDHIREEAEKLRGGVS